MSIEKRHIGIEVRVDGEEISGHAGDGSGEPTPFLGWLGLIGALDGLLSTSPSTDWPARGGTACSSSSGNASPA